MSRLGLSDTGEGCVRVQILQSNADSGARIAANDDGRIAVGAKTSAHVMVAPLAFSALTPAAELQITRAAPLGEHMEIHVGGFAQSRRHAEAAPVTAVGLGTATDDARSLMGMWRTGERLRFISCACGKGALGGCRCPMAPLVSDKERGGDGA